MHGETENQGSALSQWIDPLRTLSGWAAHPNCAGLAYYLYPLFIGLSAVLIFLPPSVHWEPGMSSDFLPPQGQGRGYYPPTHSQICHPSGPFTALCDICPCYRAVLLRSGKWTTGSVKMKKAGEEQKGLTHHTALLGLLPRADYAFSPLRTLPMEALAEIGLPLPLLAGGPQGLAPGPLWSPEVRRACGGT